MIQAIIKHYHRERDRGYCYGFSANMGLVQKCLSYLRTKRNVPTLAGALPALQQWFDSPYGEHLLEQQQRILDRELSCLFGYHLMQLSVHRNVELYKNSRVCHCFSVGAGLDGRQPPEPQAEPTETGEVQQASVPCDPVQVGIHSELDSLPFQDESVDVTILHHVLDFSSNPHQVLREANRVTIARGYIVIVGFNPWSLMGLVKPFAQLLGGNPIWRRNSLRQARITDWLKVLDCNVVSEQSAVHSLPLQHHRAMRVFRPINELAMRWRLPFGNVYCLVARKDRPAVTPLRPDWVPKANLVGAEPALSARTAAKLAVVKGAKPDVPGK